MVANNANIPHTPFSGSSVIPFFKISPAPPFCKETVPQFEKIDFSEKGERRSGGKDLERQPLAVRIQMCQGYESVRFYASGDFP
jgi:hypothetical protein